MSITRFVVTATDFGPGGGRSLKPCILADFKTEEDAYSYAIDEMREMIDRSTSDDGQCIYVMDDRKLCVHDANFTRGCQFTVMKLETELSAAEMQQIVLHAMSSKRG